MGLELVETGDPPPGRGQAIASLERLSNRLRSIPEVVGCILSYDDSTFRHVPIVLLERSAVDAIPRLLGFEMTVAPGVSAPLILPAETFEKEVTNLVSPHGLAEPFYLARHGHRFFGSPDVRQLYCARLAEAALRFTDWQVNHHFNLAFPLETNLLEKVLISMGAKNAHDVQHWLDIAFRYLPGRRILLERGLIATTPGETWAAYRNSFSGERMTSAIEQLRKKMASARENGDLVSWADSEWDAILATAQGLEERIIRVLPASLRGNSRAVQTLGGS